MLSLLRISLRFMLKLFASEKSGPDELLEYEKYVANMADKADGTVILNSSIDHAGIILAQIFKTSQKEVRILSGKLDARAYGVERVCSAAIDFLDRNQSASIKILTEEEVGSSNKFVSSVLQQKYKDRVAIKTIGLSYSPKYHFAVGDKRHFRLEADKEKCAAFVKFGGDRQGAEIASKYDILAS